MRQLAEFIPIALFFIVYQMDGKTIDIGSFSYTFDGIFSATAVLMIATVTQVLLTWIISHTLERRLLWMLVAVCLFGSLTLVFRNELFIQWKPTIFNWALALVFGASQFMGGKNLMERTLGSQLQLPHAVWTRVNWLWTLNFIVVGALNLVVAYYFSEQTWVSYKLYSAIGFAVLLMLITTLVLAPYLKDQDLSDQKKQDDDRVLRDNL